MKKFEYKEFISIEAYQQINYIKTYKPETIIEECKGRKGVKIKEHMVLASADHNSRMFTDYKDDPLRLAYKHELLSRLVRMLLSDNVQGFEASPEIIEDVIILNKLFKDKKGVDFLKNKMIIGSVNRGGLKNTAWEMDDMPLCYTVEKLFELKLDGIKTMYRIDPLDSLCGNTLKYCAEIINEADKYDLPVFIESLFVKKTDEGYDIETSSEKIIKSVVVGSALGTTSVRKFLELPINDDFAKVAEATTNSIIVLTDEAEEEPLEVVKEYTKVKNISYNVRGILLDRNVMFNDSDPYHIADAIGRVWSGIDSIENAYDNSLESKVCIGI
jgi:DhnA family fructose-bisphosphate aldolase class Ia